MKQISDPDEMQKLVAVLREAGHSLGLVPTMGALHQGHLSLVRRCRELCDMTVVSIYINPSQFSAGEDRDAYPRRLQRDLERCEHEQVDVVFSPSDAQMYAPDHSVYVAEEALSSGLCGASRPDHFKGVTTIVAKLFNLVRPDVAVFGMKDYQQAAVIRRMVRDLNFPVRVVVSPIVREPDGLAMSSRNLNLSGRARVVAAELNTALCMLQEEFAGGERNASDLCAVAHSHLRQYAGIELDYLQIVDCDTLHKVGRICGAAVVLLAAKVGQVRLIDNRVLSG